MKATATLAERKEQAARPLAHALAHAAVHPQAQPAAPAAESAQRAAAARGQDLSRVPARSACPAAPGRCPFGGACHACPLPVQRRAAGPAAPEVVPQIVHEVLRSPGQPLKPAARALMEPRFGQDFSQVRVHTGAQAEESAQLVNAQAYTVGRDVVFASGRYQPDNPGGLRLLAHELAHAVQQGHTPQPPGKIPIDASDVAEREACSVEKSLAAGQAAAPCAISPSPPGLSRVPGDEEAEEAAILAPDENFRWTGSPDHPTLVIRPRWLRRMGVSRTTTLMTGRQHPRVLRAVMAELIPRYPWASMERVEQNLADLFIQVNTETWSREEDEIPVFRSVFLVIGLPPERPVQLFRTAEGVEFYADTLTFYENAEDNPQALQTAKAALAEQIAQAYEREIGPPMLAGQRLRLIRAMIQVAPGRAQVWHDTFNENLLITLFGEGAWREYAGRPQEEAEGEGALIQIEGSARSLRLPPGVSPSDREMVLRLLGEIFGGEERPPASREAGEPPEPLVLIHADITALRELDAETEDRAELIAQLRRGRRAEAGPTPATLADVIETARARLDWQRAGRSLEEEMTAGERDQPPIVPRPVHGYILNPDRIVPGLEAAFQFVTVDQVSALRVPIVSIHWFERRVPTPDDPHPVVRDDVTNYNELDPDGPLNNRIFEFTFDEPGEYEIHAFVNHNFYLPAHFRIPVHVVTEEAILEQFRERGAAGWGQEQRAAPYRFEAVALEEALEKTAAGAALGPVAGSAASLLPSTGYEMGVRAEGLLRGEAETEYAVTFFDRRDQLRADQDRLDEMIQVYGQSRDENAREIVAQIRERRSRVQEAIAQLDRLIESGTGSFPYPVPVRAYFASRTQGVRSAPLALVTYFTVEGDGENLHYQGHILDQSEVVESRHYHFEAEADSYEALMEALFLELTESYPNGTVSFAFQVYENLEPRRRFIRFERVTDTLEQDVRDIVFSTAANIAVNLVATLLTIFPPTTALGLTLGIAYNAASLAASTGLDVRRGTFSTERTLLQLGQIALDTIPLVGRTTRFLVLSGRAYRVIEATQIAGAVYLLTEEAEIQIQNLRDGQINQLSRLQERFQEIETINASDPQLDDLRRQEVDLIQSIRYASYDVYSDLISSQALTISSAALLRHAAAPYLTGRGLETEPGVVPRHEEPAAMTRLEEPGGITAGGTTSGEGTVEPSTTRPRRREHRGATAEGEGEAFQYEYHPETPPPVVERRRGPVSTTRREEPTTRTRRDELAGRLTEESAPDVEEGVRPREIEAGSEPLGNLPYDLMPTSQLSRPESLLVARQAGVSDLVLDSGTVITRADFPEIVPDRPIPTGRPAPERLSTTGRAVSSSEIQNLEVRADLRLMQDALEGSGARILDVRIDQTQVSVGGGRAGTNRPDLQLTILQAELGGRRIYIEYDRAPGDRAMGHARRILSNDPDAIIILKILDFEPRRPRRR